MYSNNNCLFLKKILSLFAIKFAFIQTFLKEERKWKTYILSLYDEGITYGYKDKLHA